MFHSVPLAISLAVAVWVRACLIAASDACASFNVLTSVMAERRRDRLLLVSFDFLRLLVEIQTDDAPGNDQQDEQCRNNKQCIAKLVRTGGVSARMLRH